MRNRIALIPALFLLALPFAASAHQPRLVMDSVSGSETPIEIYHPEISQAFYGELKGRADYYEIRLATRTDVFLSLVAPKKGGETDFNLLLSNGDFGRLMFGAKQKWTEFFEEFGGDWYLQGPEETFNLPPGTYSIMVSSPDNYGKYSLVIGQDEAFPFSESMKALWLLPQLKVRFFGAPVWGVFEGRIYQTAGMAALIFLAALAALISFWRYRRSNRIDRHLLKRIGRIRIAKMPGVPLVFSRKNRKNGSGTK